MVNENMAQAGGFNVNGNESCPITCYSSFFIAKEICNFLGYYKEEENIKIIEREVSAKEGFSRSKADRSIETLLNLLGSQGLGIEKNEAEDYKIR